MRFAPSPPQKNNIVTSQSTLPPKRAKFKKDTVEVPLVDDIVPVASDEKPSISTTKVIQTKHTPKFIRSSSPPPPPPESMIQSRLEYFIPASTSNHVVVSSPSSSSDETTTTTTYDERTLSPRDMIFLDMLKEMRLMNREMHEMKKKLNTVISIQNFRGMGNGATTGAVKVRILERLNSATESPMKPNKSFFEWLNEDVGFTRHHLEKIFEYDFLKGIWQCLVDFLEYGPTSPICAFQQRKGILFIWSRKNKNEPFKWITMTPEHMTSMIHILKFKINELFQVYDQETIERARSDVDFSMEKNRNRLKAFGITAGPNDKIGLFLKQHIYNYISQDFEDVISEMNS